MGIVEDFRTLTRAYRDIVGLDARKTKPNKASLVDACSKQIGGFDVVLARFKEWAESNADWVGGQYDGLYHFWAYLKKEPSARPKRKEFVPKDEPIATEEPIDDSNVLQPAKRNAERSKGPQSY